MSDSIAPSSEHDHEIPIGQILTVFWRGRWLILLTTLLAAAAGVYYVQKRGTIWRATAQLYVDRSGAAALNAESFMFGMGSKNYANTQAELLVSDPILNEALVGSEAAYPKERESTAPQPDWLDAVVVVTPLDWNGGAALWCHRLAGAAATWASAYLKSLQSDEEFVSWTRVGELSLFESGVNKVAWLRKNLDVSVGKDDDIITLSLDSAQCQEACEVVNAVVSAFRQNNDEKSASKAFKWLDQLQAEQTALQREYQEKLDQQARLGTDEALGSERLAMATEVWRKINTELLDAEDEERESHYAWQTAESFRDNPTLLRQLLPSLHARGNVGYVNPPESTFLLDKIERLELERANALTQATPEHPRVLALDGAIHDLRQRMQAEGTAFAKGLIAALHQRWQNAAQQRKDLTARLEQTERDLQKLNGVDAEYRRIEAELAQNQRMQDTVNTRIREINVNDLASNDTNIDIIRMADATTAEVASGKPARLAIAVFLGLLLGCGLAWLRGLLDQRIRTADEVRDALDLNVLAIMPRSQLQGIERMSAVEAWDAQPHNAEAARSLRTAVYFGTPEGEGDILQVTSPESGDGKTTTATNLAIAMAKAGQRTLLVDADMRRPRQAERFHLPNDAGLSTVLTTDTAAASVVRDTAVEGLSLLAAGPIPPNPAEILNSAKFSALIRELAEHYDRIVVDSPPVLPVADAQIIATHCKKTLLVVRVDRSTRKRAVAARDSITGVGGQLLGAVINDMPSGFGYGYGPGYGYYKRGYGYEETDAERRGPARGRAAAATAKQGQLS